MSAARPDTWMPLYVADYLADTGHLSTRQHGAYLLLIMHYWRTGKALPTRVEHLFRICRLTADEWAEDGDAVIAFFKATPEGYTHGRVEKELQSAQDFIEKKAIAGKASAQARAQRKPNTPSTPVPTPVPTADPTNGQLEAKTLPSPSPLAAVAAPPREAVDNVPRETEPERGELRKLLETYNAELETIFTSRAPMPHQSNYATALAMVRDGITAEFARPVFVAVLTRMCAAGDEPPTALSYFRKPIAKATAESKRPMPEGKTDDELLRIPAHLDSRSRKSTGSDHFNELLAGARGAMG